MQKKMTMILPIILLAGAGQGIILSGVLWTTPGGNKLANRILGINTLIFSMGIILFMIRPGQTDTICFSCLVFQMSFFVQAPLIYLYTQALTLPGFRLSVKQLYHLIPFLVVVASYLIHYHWFIPGNETGGLTRMLDHVFLINWVLIAGLVIYILLSLGILLRHHRQIHDTHASLEKISLNWLKMILAGYIAVLLIPIGFRLFLGECGYATWGAICVVFSILMYAMGYYGLMQTEIFQSTPRADKQVAEVLSGKTKYLKSALPEDILDQNTIKLTHIMESGRLFLNSDLTLAVLASKLNLSTHHLSQIINERFNKNFYEFINSYRIEAAKNMLKDPSNSHVTISAIAFDCGFNSISAFNSSFKKITGTTPSQYRATISS